VKIVIISVKLKPQAPLFKNLAYGSGVFAMLFVTTTTLRNQMEFSHARQLSLLQIVTLHMQVIQADIEV
jgi:hypothetical protein